jgi:multidrug efflux pump subunit AcrA (membrane-fusion protein)
VITSSPAEKVGQYVDKGELIVEVHDLSTVCVEIDVSEKGIGDVNIAQPVHMKARAFPDRSFWGRVTRIAPAAEQPSKPLEERVVRVTMEIDNDDGLLKTGMTGFAKISCGKRPVYEILTRRFRRFLRVEFWSWW